MKWFKKIVILVVSIGILYSSVILFLIFIGKKEQPSSDPNTILILGAQVKGKSAKTAYPSTVLKERLDTAIPYINDHPKATVIVCGGKGADEPDTEAAVMANYLIENGVSKNQLVIEGTSTRTKENIQNAQKKKKLGKTVIITSDFHMYRSKLLAKRLGIQEVTGLPAVSHSSSTFKSNMREIIALGYGLIFDY